MMINKRLIALIEESKKYIGLTVLYQWIALLANIVFMYSLARMIEALFIDYFVFEEQLVFIALCLIAVVTRIFCKLAQHKTSFYAAKRVKKTLREKIYQKLLEFGPSYKNSYATSEIVQLAVEGVDQLETYFAQYLPQFFYAVLAPLTLFLVLLLISPVVGIVLLVFVPLIPMTIVLIQKFAKKLLSKYWGQYTQLGDTFLENLQGLTTAKIYKADGFKHKQMNEEAEHFRRITMKVLTMQLNSITVMDVVAFGGSALGAILAIQQVNDQLIFMWQGVFIILISAEFFLPMRLLGSYFHIAMNGMAASDKIFDLLDTPVREQGTKTVPESSDLTLRNVSFSYDGEKPVLVNVSFGMRANSLNALVGESGCGKSTIAALLTGKLRSYSGDVLFGNTSLSDISDQNLLQNVTYIGHQAHLFMGSVRSNLAMGNQEATEEQLWHALEQVNLAEFVKSLGGLDAPVAEKGSNLSGGQRQRLALARALLHNSQMYIFDEATSNIDVESEDVIMQQVHQLAQTKMVLVISHRLVNVKNADQIVVMQHGRVVGSGTHQELLATNDEYKRMTQAQTELENYVKGVEA
jgi:ABC transporter related